MPTRRSGLKRGGAERAPPRRDRHLAQTLRAFLRRRIGRRLTAALPRNNRIHRRHHEKIDRRRATSRNATSAFRKSPIRKALPLTVNTIAEKSGWATTAAMSGVSRSFTNALTTVPNAAPITTATARSMTLPRRTNCLNPCQHLGSSICARDYPTIAIDDSQRGATYACCRRREHGSDRQHRAPGARRAAGGNDVRTAARVRSSPGGRITSIAARAAGSSTSGTRATPGPSP